MSSKRLFFIPFIKPIILVIAAVASIAVFNYLNPPKPAVETVSQVTDRLDGSGLYVITLYATTTPILVVSESPMTTDEAAEYVVRRMLVPNTGKVVVMGVTTDHESRHTDWRSWGSLSAVGDPVLLRRLDGLIR